MEWEKERKWRQWRRYLMPSQTSAFTSIHDYFFFLFLFLRVFSSVSFFEQTYMHTQAHIHTRARTRPTLFDRYNTNKNGYKYYSVRRNLSSRWIRTIHTYYLYKLNSWIKYVYVCALCGAQQWAVEEEEKKYKRMWHGKQVEESERHCSQFRSCM